MEAVWGETFSPRRGGDYMVDCMARSRETKPGSRHTVALGLVCGHVTASVELSLSRWRCH